VEESLTEKEETVSIQAIIASEEARFGQEAKCGKE
jgi:hypothetical protein